MLAAFATSALFLISYLDLSLPRRLAAVHGQGAIRVVYFAILITHIVLAAAIVPLVARHGVARAGKRFDRTSPHRPHHAADLALRLGHRRHRLRDALS